MTSDRAQSQAYVWIWLPETTEPVVAGLLTRQDDGRLIFNYGRSYLERDDAIAIYEPELPLKAGAIETPERMQMPSAIRDGSPDAWGRRVIINRITGLKAHGNKLAFNDIVEVIARRKLGNVFCIGRIDQRLGARTAKRRAVLERPIKIG